MTNNIYRSDETDKVFSAFSKFQGEMGAVAMDSEVRVATKTGGNYSFKYATLAALVEATRPTLAKNNLGVTQIVSGNSLTTLLVHGSGQFIGAESPILFAPSDPQKYGSLISYIRRYAYAAILGLVSDEDDDANIASDNKFEKKPAGMIAGHANGDLATFRQVEKLRQLLETRMKLRTPEERLAWINEQNEVKVKDSTELTKSDASRLIGMLIGEEVGQQEPAVDINF